MTAAEHPGGAPRIRHAARPDRARCRCRRLVCVGTPSFRSPCTASFCPVNACDSTPPSPMRSPAKACANRMFRVRRRSPTTGRQRGISRAPCDAWMNAGLAAEACTRSPKLGAALRRALELWDRVPGVTVQALLDRADLHARAAAALEGIAPSRSVEHVLARRALADQAAEPTRAGLLYVQLGDYSVLADDDQAAFAAYEEAVRLVPPEPLSAARSTVLAELGRCCFYMNRQAEGCFAVRRGCACRQGGGCTQGRGPGAHPVGVAPWPTAGRSSSSLAKPASRPRSVCRHRRFLRRQPSDDEDGERARVRRQVRGSRCGRVRGRSPRGPQRAHRPVRFERHSLGREGAAAPWSLE